jgi:hypothetical protein
MPKNYTVISGDTLTKIAKQHGFDDWRVIYNHPSNAAFKAKRPNPDKIFPGDVIVIPDAPGTAPPAPPPPPPPAQARGFFVTADVMPGQSVGQVLSTFGLDSAAQVAAVRDPRNAHLHGGAAGSVPDEAVALLLSAPFVRATTVIVPIDIRLTIKKFQPVINMTDGLRPRKVGDTSPPTCTHGVDILVGRNLLAGTSLNWIQTVKKLNNPDPNAPQEFVDVGHNDRPFSEQPPRGVAPAREFDDLPCGPIATRAGGGVDFTAMTTLAVLVRGHIVLAAGTVWRFVIGTSPTLPQGVRATPPRDATDADFRNQLRILRAGVNQDRGPSGPNLDYIVRPAPNTVLT